MWWFPRYQLFSIVISVCSLPAFGQQVAPIVVDANTPMYFLESEMEIFVGDHVSTDPLQSDAYVPYDLSRVPTDRVSTWYRVRIENRRKLPLPLFITTFYMDRVVLYRKSGDRVTVLSANNGYLEPIESRAYVYLQSSVVPLTVPPHSSDWYYFQVINYTPSGRSLLKSSLRMGFMAYTQHGFMTWTRGGEYYNVFMTGMLIIIMLFNFTFYVISHNKLYGYLALVNLGYFCWAFFLGGMLLRFHLVTDLALERNLRQAVPITLITVSYALFAMQFLKMRKNLPTLRKVLVVLACMSAASTIPHLLGRHEVALIIRQFATPLIYGAILVACFLSWCKGYRLSGYFLLAALMVTIGTSIYIYIYQTPHINYLVGHFLLTFCFVLDMVVFSVLTARLAITRNIRYQVIQSKKKALEFEITTRNRQLTTLMAQKTYHHQALHQLKEKVSRDEAPHTSPHLKREINRLINFESTWDHFKMEFEQVYPTFYQRLVPKDVKLTANDYRLAALLKMNLSRQEIANITGVSVRGVDKAKERLKQKLGVEDLMGVIRGA